MSVYKMVILCYVYSEWSYDGSILAASCGLTVVFNIKEIL